MIFSLQRGTRDFLPNLPMSLPGLISICLFALKLELGDYIMADEKGNVGPQSESAEEVKERPKRRPVQRFIPPSMWTAPQSRIAPPNPADQPSSKRAETYFRRVSLPNMIDGPLPTRGQRTANLLGGVLGASIGFYLVFFHDFGSADHVFIPVSTEIV